MSFFLQSTFSPESEMNHPLPVMIKLINIFSLMHVDSVFNCHFNFTP